MSSIPVLSIAGFSGSGKTSLIERLLPALSAKGLRVAVLKHDAHEFDVDVPGKDSWRYTKAGAAVSVIASATHCAVMENRHLELPEIISRITDVDLILMEGYKSGPQPKIAFYRSASGRDMPDPDESYIAVISDVPVETALPRMALDDIEAISSFIANFARRS